ncbi:hypothetical protein B0H66DRAFT_350349 [Apodospora peruviana]|uniref:Amidohydrolase-related domain-containing protein n=1 Tax=Apodospora peruviana TaxID=516989 RepID=A0AAE0M089_9PEZI|nr:hypothetical protein B0H66DRAFT_350349 [Apodospora peruviana]
MAPDRNMLWKVPRSLLPKALRGVMGTRIGIPVHLRMIKGLHHIFDGIELRSLSFAPAAFADIDAISRLNSTGFDFSNAYRIDMHVHAVPSFYHALVPTTGGSPTPSWDVPRALQFMIDNNIARSVLSVSTPGSTVFYGNAAYSAGLARLLNEWLAELHRQFPKRFEFYAVMPLPYTEYAIREAKYALSSLGALGLGLLTNHEGLYLGNPAFAPFYSAIDALPGGPHVCMVHPTEPLMRAANGTVISTANPTLYNSGLVEFYFETARALMDLISTRTLTNYTNIRYSIAHVGGAFPSIRDRFLKRNPSLDILATEALNTKVWYDSAGPTYFSQVKGLLGYDVPASQLVFGSDWPYSGFSYAASAQAIVDAEFLTATQKKAIFVDNAEDMLCTHFH